MGEGLDHLRSPIPAPLTLLPDVELSHEGTRGLQFPKAGAVSWTRAAQGRLLRAPVQSHVPPAQESLSARRHLEVVCPVPETAPVQLGFAGPRPEPPSMQRPSARCHLCSDTVPSRNGGVTDDDAAPGPPPPSGLTLTSMRSESSVESHLHPGAFPAGSADV